MATIAYLNGEYLPLQQARVPVMDRGFLFGDAVYEVIPFFGGVGFRLEQHLQRLQHSLDAVGIELKQDWLALFNELLARNPGRHQAIYLQVSRGVMAERGLRYDASIKPTLFAYSYPIKLALNGPLVQVEPVTAATVPDLRWQRCDIKATGLLANVLAMHQAQAKSAKEALMVRQGYLTEGASCNVFLIEQGRVFTPLLDGHILGGTTRMLLLELLDDLGIECIEQPLQVERLERADEVWISSSTRGVLPVTEIDAKVVGSGRPGPLWLTVAQRFQQFEQQLMAQNEGQ